MPSQYTKINDICIYEQKYFENISKLKLKNTRPFKIYQSCEIIENRVNKIWKICMVEIKNDWWEKITDQSNGEVY